jgi:hypothetical protein
VKCRHCKKVLEHKFLDLGFSPPSNSYLKKEQLSKSEVYYPLRLFVCDNCFLVQTEDFAAAEEFFSPDYAYFSSVSSSWNEHCRQYFSMIVERFKLGAGSHVIELAANDGYLLRYFKEKEIPCLGVEPTESTAEKARSYGIPIIQDFFTEELAENICKNSGKADLVIGNNVYAHVPDINDFTIGIQKVLSPQGVVTLEFPHLLNLIEKVQFDTVYHEHFSYLSLLAVIKIFEKAGLRVFDVEQLSTHGGSLRVYGCHKDAEIQTEDSVSLLLKQEESFGLKGLNLYLSFQKKAEQVKDGLLEFLLQQKRLGKSIAGYGAAAKGNTILNFAGVKPDLLPLVCDAAPSKIGKFLPGSHIPVLCPEEIARRKPDLLLVLPWNISEEVAKQNSFIRSWGGQFVVAVPEIKVF